MHEWVRVLQVHSHHAVELMIFQQEAWPVLDFSLYDAASWTLRGKEDIKFNYGKLSLNAVGRGTARPRVKQKSTRSVTDNCLSADADMGRQGREQGCSPGHFGQAGKGKF